MKKLLNKIASRQDLALAGYGRLLRIMSKDMRVGTMHISLLSGLFVQWQKSSYQKTFAVTRKTLMAFSKIASIATYHKCMRELDEYGYLCYTPSYDPKLGSKVSWIEDDKNVVHRKFYSSVNGGNS